MLRSLHAHRTTDRFAKSCYDRLREYKVCYTLAFTKPNETNLFRATSFVDLYL